ncbi:MAG: GNAT family N-acetyltransferase [Anaerolineaceae bacterium]|jgi:ribosomal-protein-alanine N-acetyltransferase|nr:GNAT family N-acetyltransferase [Anaerolineaceae bacterium]
MISETSSDQPNQQELIWTVMVADWRDYTQLQQLERACFNDDDSWPFWDLIGVLTLPGTVRLKAVVDGVMVGFIGGEREAGRRLGWVTTLGVMPAYRRYGIGQALLRKCEKELAMPAIRLSVRASNMPAIQLYENAGYEVVDRWQKYYTGGEDALVLEKRR